MLVGVGTRDVARGAMAAVSNESRIGSFRYRINSKLLFTNQDSVEEALIALGPTVCGL